MTASYIAPRDGRLTLEATRRCVTAVRAYVLDDGAVPAVAPLTDDADMEWS